MSNKVVKLWKDIKQSLYGYTALAWVIAVSCIGFFVVHGIRFIVFPLFIKGSWYAESWHEDLYDLLSGIMFDVLLSFVFYYLLVYEPEHRRKKIIKNNFNESLENFKEHTIVLFFTAARLPASHDQQSLTDINEFRKFFAPHWPAVIEGLTKNPRLLRQVIKELLFLREEINFVLGRIEFFDRALFEFLNSASYHIYHYQDIAADSEQLDEFFDFLWQIFTTYNGLAGNSVEKRPSKECEN